MEVRCPKCKSKIKIDDSKIIKIFRQTTIIEFVGSGGNQPHTEKVFLNREKNILFTQLPDFIHREEFLHKAP